MMTHEVVMLHDTCTCLGGMGYRRISTQRLQHHSEERYLRCHALVGNIDSSTFSIGLIFCYLSGWGGQNAQRHQKDFPRDGAAQKVLTNYPRSPKPSRKHSQIIQKTFPNQAENIPKSSKKHHRSIPQSIQKTSPKNI